MFKTAIDMTDETMTDSIQNQLPAYFNQGDDSNNQKLLTIIAMLFNNDKNNIWKIYDLVRISKAQGQILTDLADDYGVTRIDDDDDFLRFELRWQILKSKTPTTINGLKSLISMLLNIEPSAFDIFPTDNIEEIEVANIPFDFNSGSHSDLKRKILSDSIQSVLPVEYNLKDIKYSKDSSMEYYVGIMNHKLRTKESEVINLG